MLPINQEEVSIDEIFSIIEDILNFIEDDNDNEYETNQYMVGMANLFRGYTVKVWKGVKFHKDKYRKLNKILTKYFIMYYTKCWKDRNDHLHNEEKQKERVIQ